jgi:hypothetical protein
MARTQTRQEPSDDTAIVEYRPLTFAEKVELIVRLCQTVIRDHGGQRTDTPSTRHAGFYRQGDCWYRFPSDVKEWSEPDYALRILYGLRKASTTTSFDEARKYAWDAGQLIFEAHVVFKGKATALHAAFQAGQVHAARARRRRSGANLWQKEVDRRRSARSKHSVMMAIEQREGLKEGTVKKALQRRRKRLKKARQQRSSLRRRK